MAKLIEDCMTRAEGLELVQLLEDWLTYGSGVPNLTQLRRSLEALKKKLADHTAEDLAHAKKPKK